MKTITHSQYLQLLGLMTLAKQYNAMLEQLLIAAATITQEKDVHTGHVSDMVYGSRELDDGLNCLEITVLPPAAGDTHG